MVIDVLCDLFLPTPSSLHSLVIRIHSQANTESSADCGSLSASLRAKGRVQVGVMLCYVTSRQVTFRQGLESVPIAFSGS